MALTAFVEDRFPLDISFGASGGPQYRTTVVTTTSGFETRTVNWSVARGKWNVSHGLKTIEQLDPLVAFYRARRGKAIGFRFRDWTDYASDMASVHGSVQQQADPLTMPPDGSMTPIAFGTGTGVATDFQLSKTYQSPGGDDPIVRDIRKPVSSGTPQAADPNAVVRIYDAGTLQTEGAGNDYVIDTTTGIVSFTVAPANGNALTWDGLFDIPVRFDTDEFNVTIEHFDTHNWPAIDVVELRIQ